MRCHFPLHHTVPVPSSYKATSTTSSLLSCSRRAACCCYVRAAYVEPLRRLQIVAWYQRGGAFLDYVISSPRMRFNPIGHCRHLSNGRSLLIGLLAFDMPFDSTYVHMCRISIVTWKKGSFLEITEKKIYTSYYRRNRACKRFCFSIA